MQEALGVAMLMDVASEELLDALVYHLLNRAYAGTERFDKLMYAIGKVGHDLDAGGQHAAAHRAYVALHNVLDGVATLDELAQFHYSRRKAQARELWEAMHPSEQQMWRAEAHPMRIAVADHVYHAASAGEKARWDEETLELITRHLTADEAQAVDVLDDVEVPLEEYRDEMKRLLLIHKHVDVDMGMVMHAFGNLGTPEAIPVLLNYTQHHQMGIRIAVADGLGRIGKAHAHVRHDVERHLMRMLRTSPHYVEWGEVLRHLDSIPAAASHPATLHGLVDHWEEHYHAVDWSNCVGQCRSRCLHAPSRCESQCETQCHGNTNVAHRLLMVLKPRIEAARRLTELELETVGQEAVEQQQQHHHHRRLRSVVRRERSLAILPKIDITVGEAKRKEQIWGASLTGMSFLLENTNMLHIEIGLFGFLFEAKFVNLAKFTFWLFTFKKDIVLGFAGLVLGASFTNPVMSKLAEAVSFVAQNIARGKAGLALIVAKVLQVMLKLLKPKVAKVQKQANPFITFALAMQGFFSALINGGGFGFAVKSFFGNATKGQGQLPKVAKMATAVTGAETDMTGMVKESNVSAVFEASNRTNTVVNKVVETNDKVVNTTYILTNTTDKVSTMLDKGTNAALVAAGGTVNSTSKNQGMMTTIKDKVQARVFGFMANITWVQKLIQWFKCLVPFDFSKYTGAIAGMYRTVTNFVIKTARGALWKDTTTTSRRMRLMNANPWAPYYDFENELRRVKLEQRARREGRMLGHFNPYADYVPATGCLADLDLAVMVNTFGVLAKAWR